MNTPLLYACSSRQQCSDAMAKYVLEEQTKAVAARGVFRVAISGGGLPDLLSQGIAESTEADWAKWDVWLADERVVPLDHAESNYRLNLDEFFNGVPIPKDQIHAIDPTYLDDAELCAQDYEKRIADAFKSGDNVPVFDLILLGMGPDGHTVSLFPGHGLLQERSRYVAPITDSPKPPPVRITLTYPVLEAARALAFEAYDGMRWQTLKEVLEIGDSWEEGLPAARVRAKDTSTRVRWFTSADVASHIEYPVTNLAEL